MTWNYRIVQFPTHVALHEVHYCDGKPVSMTVEPISFTFDDEGELIGALEMALADAKGRGVLAASEVGAS